MSPSIESTMATPPDPASSKERESFIFYRSFQEGIDELSARNQLTIYRSIANYALDRSEPRLDGAARLMWLLIKPQLDANYRKYTNGCKGGAPKGNTNASKRDLIQPKTTGKQTNVNPNPKANAKEKVNTNDCELDRIMPPTLSDIEQYIANNDLQVDGSAFHDYYAANGWYLGNKQMADWRAAVRIWSRRTSNENKLNQNELDYDL